MTPRPTDSTGEFEDFSDEVEELCISELKKCLRVPEEQVPLKGLDVQEDLTYNEHPMIIFGDLWESYSGQEDKDVQNAMESPYREDGLRKTYPDLFASHPIRISGQDSCKGVGFVTP